MIYKYNLVVCGGTFDYLHEGHKSFLRFLLSISKKLVIGLTSDYYTQVYKPSQNITPYKRRLEQLQNFFEVEKVSTRTQIFPIDDIFGPSIDPLFSFDAIGVTIDTIRGADVVNKKREELGLSKLPIIITPLKKDREGKKISSTDIRKKKNSLPNTEFFPPVWKEEIRTLPATMRLLLAKPLGRVLTQNDNLLGSSPQKIVTVGDVTTQKFLLSGIVPKIAIIDFLVERKKVQNSQQGLEFYEKKSVVDVVNPAGSISPSLWQAIEKSIQINRNSLIIVQGEEDLAVIPLVLLLPLDFVVYYGQPHQGLVEVKITPDVKLTVRGILSKFQASSY